MKATKRVTPTKRKLGRPPVLEDAVPVLVYLERWQRDGLKSLPGSLNENVRQAVSGLLECHGITPASKPEATRTTKPRQKPAAHPSRPTKGRGAESA